MVNLKVGNWYLISSDLQRIKYIGRTIPARYLGKDSTGWYSLEFLKSTSYEHKGESSDGIAGRKGYCMYINKNDIKIIRELSNDEVFLWQI